MCHLFGLPKNITSDQIKRMFLFDDCDLAVFKQLVRGSETRSPSHKLKIPKFSYLYSACQRCPFIGHLLWFIIFNNACSCKHNFMPEGLSVDKANVTPILFMTRVVGETQELNWIQPLETMSCA